MKFLKNLILTLVVTTSIVFTSCVDNNDYTLPNIIGNEENKALNAVLDSINKGDLTLRTISEIKQDWFTSRQATQVTQNLVVKGYVTSSDASGNFFREFYMQDAIENATAGIKVVLSQTNSYNQFNVGREVYIRLKGLYIGETRSGDNDVTIGGFVEDGGTELEAISENQIKKFNHILRSENSEEIIPLSVKFSAIGEQHLGMLVKVDNVFFDESLAGKTYFDPTRDFDTDRLMKSCDGFDFTEYILSTSSFANFGGALLPTGGGSIKAIVTKNYNRQLRLALNSVEDVDMNGEKCALLDINDFNETFSEDFSSNNFDNWTLKDIKGSANWRLNNSSSNPIKPTAEINGFRRGENEDWLISKEIDLTSVSNAFLIFDNVVRFFANESDLKLFISSDYAGGDPNSDGTWTELSYVKDRQTSSSDYDSSSSGLIDLEQVKGKKLFIAFKYNSTSSRATFYRLDNIKVLTK